MPELPELTKGPDFATLLADLSTRVELMFDDPGLSALRGRDPTHPAVERYDVLQELLRESSHLLPSHAEACIGALRQWLDARSWAPTTSPNAFWDLLPDDATRKRTVAVLADAEQFDDALAELFYWGWLKGAGLGAERVEEEGLSDIVIGRASQSEVRSEVKRIHRGTDPRGIARVIQKANQQIKRSSPAGGGVVFISLDVPLRRAPPDEAIPADVQLYIDEAIQATRRDNSSVGRVVLTWDDFMTFGEHPQPIGLCVRRRSTVVDHAAPVVTPAISSDRLDIGISVFALMSFYPSSDLNQTPQELRAALRSVTDEGELLGSYPIRLSASLHGDTGGPIVLRASHAKQAFANPDAVAIHTTDPKSAVVTKRLKTADSDFLLVLHGGWLDASNQWLVDGAYRLYDDPSILGRLERDPNEAFATVLERYGTRFSIGLGKAWWLPELRVPTPDGVSLQPANVLALVASACGIGPTAWDSAFAASFMINEDHEVVVGDAYWINADKYRVAAIQASRGA
jgi:hypothetical protein